MQRMGNKISMLITIIPGAVVGGLTADVVSKIVLTTLVMCIGTIASFYLRRFLERFDKKRKARKKKRQS